MTHRSDHHGPSRSGGHRGRRHGRGPGRRLRFLARRLDLSDEQVTELSERLGRHRAKGRELFLAHRSERMRIIRDVLDEEQLDRFDAMLRRRGERRSHRRHHHHAHHRGHDQRAASPPDDVSEDDVRV